VVSARVGVDCARTRQGRGPLRQVDSTHTRGAATRTVVHLKSTDSSPTTAAGIAQTGDDRLAYPSLDGPLRMVAQSTYDRPP
jgi:hypothetical protein